MLVKNHERLMEMNDMVLFLKDKFFSFSAQIRIEAGKKKLGQIRALSYCLSRGSLWWKAVPGALWQKPLSLGRVQGGAHAQGQRPLFLPQQKGAE